MTTRDDGYPSRPAVVMKPLLAPGGVPDVCYCQKEGQRPPSYYPRGEDQVRHSSEFGYFVQGCIGMSLCELTRTRTNQ